MRESAKRRSGLYVHGYYQNLDDKKHNTFFESFNQGTQLLAIKIQKIGFIMLWIPEPTGITCAVGGPMILAGRYLEKVYNGAKISDVQ